MKKHSIGHTTVWGKYRVGYMCTTCGQGGADEVDNPMKAKAFFNCHSCDGIMFPSEIAKPYLGLKKSEPLIPPPDMGEYCGVKVPARFWDTCNKKKTFVVWVSFTGGMVHIYDPVNCHMRFYRQSPKFLVKYTGQDKVDPVDVEALKRAARLE